MFLTRSTRSRDLVRLCIGCGCMHSVKHATCFACSGSLSEPVKKAVRDFSEQVALGDLQQGILLSTFDYVVTEYPWPSGRLHVAAVFCGLSNLSQLRKSHIPLLGKIRDSTKSCLKSKNLPKGVFGFCAWSPLRMLCMHYIVPPLTTEITKSPDWVSLDQVVQSLETSDRVIKIT